MANKFGLSLSGIDSVRKKFSDIDRRADGPVKWTVGPSVEYSAYVEFGTRHMAAQPYLRPAAQSVRSNITKHIARNPSLSKAVESAALEVEAQAKKRAPVDTGALRSSIAAVPAR